jgi:cytochrome c-type biogenesis protein CcmH/NrfG
MAVAHALLGSLYALYGQTDAAVVAWKRSLELDPTNKAVREAILQHSPQRKLGR